MAWADWTVVDGTWALDAGVKYSGASSVKCSGGLGQINKTGYTNTQGYFKFRGRTNAGQEFRMKHPNYNAGIAVASGATTPSTWQIIEFWFWYDAGSNTKWIRTKLDGVLTGNTNAGAGAPATDNFTFLNDSQCWIDELECYG